MSNLYNRVYTSFYSHRKTAKLRAKIGDDAFWVPPKIWAYAAENQPDGNLSGYSSEELCMLIGCSKHCSSILQMLKECGFIDQDGMIHDWQEHNEFHVKAKARAEKAAEIRWKKEKMKPKHAPSITQALLKHGESPPVPPSTKDTDMYTYTSNAPSNAPSITQALLIKDTAPSSLRERGDDSKAIEIYEAYPKKVGRKKAISAIDKALKSATFDQLIVSVRAFANAVNGQDMQYIPNPTTWFNQERWLDDPATWVKNETKKHHFESKEIKYELATKII